MSEYYQQLYIKFAAKHSKKPESRILDEFKTTRTVVIAVHWGASTPTIFACKNTMAELFDAIDRIDNPFYIERFYGTSLANMLDESYLDIQADPVEDSSCSHS
jgi:hypothetical protein